MLTVCVDIGHTIRSYTGLVRASSYRGTSRRRFTLAEGDDNGESEVRLQHALGRLQRTVFALVGVDERYPFGGQPKRALYYSHQALALTCRNAPLSA